MPPKSKKPLKKPSVKPRKNIIRSTITKQNVKQVVNVHLPSKSRTYRRSTDGKTVTKTIVQPSPSMVQPIYIPQPMAQQPYNFNESNVTSSLIKLLSQIQTKPHIEEKEQPITNPLEEFRNLDMKEKNENFLNELENKKIIDKVDEIRPIDENIYEPEEEKMINEINSNFGIETPDLEEFRYLYKKPEEKEKIISESQPMTQEEKQKLRDVWGAVEEKYNKPFILKKQEEQIIKNKIEKLRQDNNKIDSITNSLTDQNRNITKEEKKEISKLYSGIGNTKNSQKAIEILQKAKINNNNEINKLYEKLPKKQTKKAEKKKLYEPVEISV